MRIMYQKAVNSITLVPTGAAYEEPLKLSSHCAEEAFVR